VDIEIVRAVDLVEAREHSLFGTLDLGSQLADAAAANDDLFDPLGNGLDSGFIVYR
jgi:hypothetical protein